MNEENDPKKELILQLRREAEAKLTHADALEAETDELIRTGKLPPDDGDLDLAWPELPLPLSLRDIHLPVAARFLRSGKTFYIGIDKARACHLESHLGLLYLATSGKQVCSDRADFERLWEAVRPLMEPEPDMTLLDALRILCSIGIGSC